ncbi:transglycosylase [Pelagivirga sediminicola]|uniref:Transglycosylase n=2 Tax=Pelagivirga sediminicola TaxID=2170575 RepID=A0A2T7G5T4_9RHOB|nr:lytic transglycosylase domain-containing protein [Pelagivirga sediminicola]PVA09781.1 transglycosylase [Pelagivirga sediminicola]
MKILRSILAASLLFTAACADKAPTESPTISSSSTMPLHPGETPQIRQLVNKYADHYQVPRPLVHKVIQRESDYRPNARNGPYMGMMQILPATARGMGFSGRDTDLLDAETNLHFAVKYLRGAWMVSDGDMDEAVMWYAKGYYYEARNRCLLVETELKTREIAKHCR